MRLTLELVDQVKQIAPPNVGRPSKKEYFRSAFLSLSWTLVFSFLQTPGAGLLSIHNHVSQFLVIYLSPTHAHMRAHTHSTSVSLGSPNTVPKFPLLVP